MSKTNLDIVFEAIEDLHAQEQIVTRETLSEVCDLPMTIIDDRVGHLVDSGLVHRVQRGVFVPAPRHKPARIISKMVLPGGIVKIEIGDDHVLTLTPREHRTLGELMVSAAMQFSSIELGHQAATVNAELSLRVHKLQRDLNAAQKKRKAEGNNTLPFDASDKDCE